MGLFIRIFDVSGAYLLADIDKEIYMSLPPLYPNASPKLVRLKKSLYGLKQSGALWREKLDSALQRLGCVHTDSDECVYILDKDGERCFIVIHVDDMLFATTSNPLVDTFMSDLSDELEAVIEEVTTTGSHLGINVTHNVDGSITLSQPRYIAKMVDELGLEDEADADTPYQIGSAATTDRVSIPIDVDDFAK